MNVIRVGRCVLFHKRLQLLQYASKTHHIKYTTSKNVRIISHKSSPYPKSVKQVFPPKKTQLKSENSTNSDLRINSVNMQMLSRNLYSQIFKSKSDAPESTVVDYCISDLHKHKIDTHNVQRTPDVQLQLPPLQGRDIEEHFYNIGESQSAPYRTLLLELLKEIPDAPDKWVLEAGWTRYAPGKQPEQVPHPLENAIVLDVEVCVQISQLPVIATAVTKDAWYGWVSQTLTDDNDGNYARTYNIRDLIPLEDESGDVSTSHKVVVGHNVSYDRARIKEQYLFEKTLLRFVDTMSLHVCVSGITSYQRALLRSTKLDRSEENWMEKSSLNSLSEVHKLYCGSQVDKSTRDVFVEGNIADVKQNFQEVMRYCAGDVNATFNVLKVVFPMFLKRFPHPVTFAGMLELSTAYLPVNGNWRRYIDDCEQTYEDMNGEAKLLLVKRANDVCQLMHEEQYKKDIWMWDQDWETQELKMKKKYVKKKEDVIENLENDSEVDALEEKFKHLIDSRVLLPVRRPHLPGYPTWYRKLCTKPDARPNWIPGPHLISTSMQITPKLLRLTWEGFPLHYIREKGWGMLVPHSDDVEDKRIPLKELLQRCPLISGKPDTGNIDTFEQMLHNEVEKDLSKREWWKTKPRKDKTEGVYKGTGIWCNTDIEDCVYFLKLPHKDGVSHRVGNPLARDFLNKFSDNVLAGDEASAERLLWIARTVSYWRNNRDRIMQQQVVWLKKADLPKALRKEEGLQFGAILPLTVVCGTLTRRAMEPTWMTASNALSDRLGSELRSIIQAPPGYNIVGADVDSQELWIASVIGDSHRAKIHGSTPLGWMTLIGNKSNGTDTHSMTAKAVGISRDHAKVINYARIYGAGQNFAERLLKQFNPSMTEAEARSKAVKMFQLTKGKKIYRLKQEYVDGALDDVTYSSWKAFEMAKLHGKTVWEMFERPKWVGGSESAMFNRLEEIAGSDCPVTPFLNARLSRALEPSGAADDRSLPTRVNWVVQSGAVDFLHLMLVSMNWLMKGRARFCLSFHDEVRYLVPNHLRYEAALAMQMTNLLTRSFCCVRLGINDLPMSVAFFSSVEVDTVLRKEAHSDCKTPSNPHGLKKGYGIPDGESLTVHQCIEKTGGRLSVWTEK